MLKIFAFQDRHERKDAYDLVFCLLHYGDGPSEAGAKAARSSIADEPIVTETLELLAERFSDAEQDGPMAYSAFLATPGDTEGAARLRREAVATVAEFLEGFRRH